MKRNEFEKIIKRLDGLWTGFGGVFKITREDIDAVIPHLAKAMIKRNVINNSIFKHDDVSLPELKDAVKKVIYVYHYYKWCMDDSLFSLLCWTLHSGSKTHRSQQKEKSKIDIGAFLEALHERAKGKPIAAAKLARLLSVSPTTIRRWRKHPDYQDRLRMPIDDQDMINRADEFLNGHTNTRAATKVNFGVSELT
ncbi:MAG: hypothetical protein WBQ37_14745 [Candidatus Competibacter sp.]